MIRARLGRTQGASTQAAEATEPDVVSIDPGDLRRVVKAPDWLRDAGILSWLLVGSLLIIVGAVWLMSLTGTIVFPVVTASIVAAVAGPVVGWLAQHRVPRGIGAALMLLLIVALAALILILTLSGITSQADSFSAHLSSAADKISGWVHDLGVKSSTTNDAAASAKSGTGSAAHLLLNGLSSGIKEFASLAVFLSLTALSLFFLLKDGPALRAWGERHMGVPKPVAHTITGEMLRALRGYFLGVTIVALFNAVLIGGAALIIGVPMAGTIAVVTFLGAYIPFFGAWIAGAFAVLLALGAEGTSAALAMAVVALLANGMLQQMVQPIAMGTALDMHPLAVLVVTISAGCLFGTIGLVVAAPITSAVVRISHRLAAAGAEEEAKARQESGDPPPEGGIAAAILA